MVGSNQAASSRFWDVVVVGGGPAGLWLARKVASLGHQVLLVDERSSIGRKKICTGIISAEAFEKFSLPRDAVLNSIQKLRFYSPQGRKLEYVHPELLAYVVNRSAFDSSLADLAMETGAEVRQGLRVRGVEISPDGVKVQAHPVENGSSPCSFQGKLLVIATGVNFRLNRKLGLGAPKGFLNAVQAHVRVAELDCTHCFAGRQVAPGAFGWLVPLQPGWGRIGLMAERPAAPYFRRFLKRIRPFLRQPMEEVAAEFKPIAQRFEGKSSAFRVIAVGEAAGQVKTTTGGGIYYGLLGAEAAGDVIDRALRNNYFEAHFLGTHQARLESRIRFEIASGYFYRKLYSKLNDFQIEALFQLARTNGIIPLVKKRAQFDWHAPLLHSVARYRTVQKILGLDLDQVRKF